MGEISNINRVTGDRTINLYFLFLIVDEGIYIYERVYRTTGRVMALGNLYSRIYSPWK